uniref:Uncharacterized protein n=1 Tax=Peptoclostridium acidaminophilum TaxID=1731 RepID=Q8GCS7_PEPAC|nr:unknown [Peptoclostridium acidaminophilum]
MRRCYCRKKLELHMTPLFHAYQRLEYNDKSSVDVEMQVLM